MQKLDLPVGTFPVEGKSCIRNNNSSQTEGNKIILGMFSAGRTIFHSLFLKNFYCENSSDSIDSNWLFSFVVDDGLIYSSNLSQHSFCCFPDFNLSGWVWESSYLLF